MASITTHQPKRAPSGTLLLATAITLAGILIAGAWLLLRDGGAPAPAAGPALQDSPVAAPREMLTGWERGGLAELQAEQEAKESAGASALGGRSEASGADSDQEMYARWQKGQPAGDQTVHVVRSVEEAEQLRRGLAEADAIRAALGAPPLATTVLVIGEWQGGEE